MRRGERSGPLGRSGGYGLVAVLVLVALTSMALSVAAQSWADAARRDKEQQLLRIGLLYVQALERYRRSSPGTDKRLPQELDERAVADDDPVLGVVGDVGDLLGEQADVERVQDGAHGRHREVGLEVLLVVPHERPDAVAFGDAAFRQR